MLVAGATIARFTPPRIRGSRCNGWNVVPRDVVSTAHAVDNRRHSSVRPSKARKYDWYGSVQVHGWKRHAAGPSHSKWKGKRQGNLNSWNPSNKSDAFVCSPAPPVVGTIVHQKHNKQRQRQTKNAKCEKEWKRKRGKIITISLLKLRPHSWLEAPKQARCPSPAYAIPTPSGTAPQRTVQAIRIHRWCYGSSVSCFQFVWKWISFLLVPQPFSSTARCARIPPSTTFEKYFHKYKRIVVIAFAAALVCVRRSN